MLGINQNYLTICDAFVWKCKPNYVMLDQVIFRFSKQSKFPMDVYFL